MSGRISKMKVKVPIYQDDFENKLTKIRERLHVLSDVNELNEWVKSQPDKIDENGFNEIQTLFFDLNKKLPPKPISDLLNCLFNQITFDESNIRLIKVMFIKPLNKNQWELKNNGGHNVNKYESGSINVSHRFIYFFGKESLSYDFINITKIGAEYGFKAPASSQIENVEETTDKKYAYMLGINQLVAMTLSYKDCKSFIEKARLKGHRDQNVEKSKYRWSMVIDIIPTSEYINQLLSNEIKPISDMIRGNNPKNAKASKMLGNFEQISKQLEEENKEKQEMISSIFDDEETNEKVPDLIEIKEDK